MNKREKALIFLLLAVVILFGGFNFLIKPAMKSLDDAKAEYDVKKSEFDVVQMLIDRKLTVTAENEELETKIREATDSFFPELTIDKIQYFFTEQARKTDVTIGNINMTTASTTTINDTINGETDVMYGLKETAELIESSAGIIPETDAKSISSNVSSQELLCSGVTMACSGTYRNVMKFVDNLSSMDRTVVVESITLNDMQSGNVTANISAKMYMLEKLSEDEISNTTIKATTAKSSLF